LGKRSRKGPGLVGQGVRRGKGGWEAAPWKGDKNAEQNSKKKDRISQWLVVGCWKKVLGLSLL